MTHRFDPDQLDTLFELIAVIPRCWRPGPRVVPPRLSLLTFCAPPAGISMIEEIAEIRAQVADAHERNGLLERAVEIAAKLGKYAMGGALSWQEWSDEDQRQLEKFVALAYAKVAANGGFPDLVRRLQSSFFERGIAVPIEVGAPESVQTVA